MESDHCDPIDQARLQIADTKKKGPEGPHFTFDRDQLAKLSDRSRGDGHEGDVGNASASSLH